ncbi:MAG: hypothetical protein GX947_07260 [Tissierellia bacterium]|nr:hypothetical protein [Tissierellia bacterium]
MPVIILIMKRKPIAQGLINSLEYNSEVHLIYEPYYHKTNLAIRNHKAKAALIEVTETGPYDIGYCLALCKELRKNTPECKLVLMCSEEDEKTINLVVDAKGKKEIDDFVFFDVTIDYLASKLISI